MELAMVTDELVQAILRWIDAQPDSVLTEVSILAADDEFIVHTTTRKYRVKLTSET